jgi:phosphoglycolate phosphatase-like HAD superfamily hydrolase
MKTGILFDLDGTLLDTLEDLLDATNYALAEHGYPARTLKELRRFVGNGAQNQIRLALPEDLAAWLGRKCQGNGGARQMRRLVQEQVEGPLAAFLLRCSRKPSRITGSLKEEAICFQE